MKKTAVPPVKTAIKTAGGEKKSRPGPPFAAFLLGAVSLFVLLPVFYILFSYRVLAQTSFNGPTCSGGGNCSGAIGIDSSNNLAVGTSTTRSGVKLLVVGSSTAAGEYAIQVLNAQTGPVLLVTNDGRVTIGSTTFASGTAAAGTFGASPPYGGLYVHGPIQSDLDLRANGLAIGTTTPQSGGNAVITGNLSVNIPAGNVTAGVFGGAGSGALYAFPSNLGVGTSSQVGLPQALSVYGNAYLSGGASADNIKITNSGGNPKLAIDTATTSASQSAIIELRAVTTQWFIETSGYAPSDLQFVPGGGYAGNVTTVIKQNTGWIGIGTSTPQALLSVGTSTTSTVAIFGGGTGKITVGTIDPIYSIGGRQYATYSPEATGVKVETSGIARLKKTAGGKWEAKIDFNNPEKGSDLWLFAKTTDLKDNFGKLVVLLTPSFDGRAWYRKDGAALTLSIFGEPGRGESGLDVSYLFVAPRFDAANWPNSAPDESGGFIISD